MGIVRAAVSLGLAALVSIGALPVTTVAGAPAPPPQGALIDAGSFHPLTPMRVLDTRSDLGGHPRAMQSTETFGLQLTGRGGVPATGVSAVVLNLTATEANGEGFVTVYPTGQQRPVASALNLAPGATIANAVTSRVGARGRVDLYLEGAPSHLVVDVVGWYDQFRAFTASSGQAGYTPLSRPARILDSRSALGGHPRPFAAGESFDLAVAAAGVPLEATAVQLSVTGTQASATTFVTVWNTGAPRPTASTLNLARGQTAANSAAVKVGGGSVSLFNDRGTTHLLVDVLGYFRAMPDASSGQFAPLAAPVRVLDTRTATGGRPGPVPGGQTVTLPVAGVAAVPRSARAIALTVTVTQPTGQTFVSVWPGGTRAATSDLNVVADETRAVLVVVGVGADGAVRLYNDAGSAHLVVDVIGWYTGAAAAPAAGRPALPPSSAVLSVFPAPAGPGGRPVVGQGQRRSADELDDYWTPDRLAAADDSDLAERATTGPPAATRFVSPAASHPSYPVFSQGYLSADDHRDPIGRLYASTPDGAGGVSCSGTVVALNVVLTAAHCVYSLGQGFNNDLIFVPGQRGESFPFGTWQPTAWYVYSQFYTANSGDGFGPLDYALLVFDPDATGTDIGTRSGYLPVLAEAVAGTVTSYGYPAEGWFAASCAAVACQVWACTSPVSGYSSGGGWYEMGIGCNTGGGASGGPIIAQREGTWYVVSVNSNSSNDVEAEGGSRYYTGNMWGPVLNGWTSSLLAQHARY